MPDSRALSITRTSTPDRAAEYYGNLPWVVGAEGGDPDTLPSRQVRDLAEGGFADLFPQADRP